MQISTENRQMDRHKHIPTQTHTHTHTHTHTLTLTHTKIPGNQVVNIENKSDIWKKRSGNGEWILLVLTPLQGEGRGLSINSVMYGREMHLHSAAKMCGPSFGAGSRPKTINSPFQLLFYSSYQMTS